MVEHVLVGFEFLDEEEFAVVFDDGGDGDVGLPGHWRRPFRSWDRCAVLSRHKAAPTRDRDLL
ncbi:hypothetical protein D3C81_2051370 [compost metagenome]